jgi:hypothetical protein
MKASKYIEILENSIEENGGDYDINITSADLMENKKIGFYEVASLMFEEACVEALVNAQKREQEKENTDGTN